MKSNMGITDKVIRIIVALIVIGLYAFNIIGGALAIVLLILSGIFIATSFVGFCPLYLPFGFSTKHKE